jgi:hypothetical protein
MTPAETLIAAIEAERETHAAYTNATGAYYEGIGSMSELARTSTARVAARKATDAALREALGITDA